MKNKTHYCGTVSDCELKKSIRKPLPPPPQKHKSAKDYSRKKNKKHLPEE
jgi:hypothetical protein